MRTVRTKVFKFEELEPKAQEKVLTSLRDINTDHNWYTWSLDGMAETLAEGGFKDAKIWFTLSYSQGDGASFDAEIDLSAFTDNKRIIAIAEAYCNFRIEKTSYANHYSHEKTRHVEYDALSDRHPRINEALHDLFLKIEALRLAKSKQIYRDLRNEYEYLTSKEAIIETIQSNDYEFLKDGSIYHNNN